MGGQFKEATTLKGLPTEIKKSKDNGKRLKQFWILFFNCTKRYWNKYKFTKLNKVLHLLPSDFTGIVTPI